ncbi:MAG: hypothetical protein AB1467_00670 [Candidatus Diapherotrites archaeon]
MVIQMRIDDEVRLKVLEALLKKGSVVPNLRQIKKQTGLHLATIKSSIDFLMKEGLLHGFGPRIDFRKFNLKVDAVELLQIDFSQKPLLDKFLKEIKGDDHLYRLSSIIGSGNLNILAQHIYSDIESFHHNTQKHYYEIPGILRLIKDRQIFYTTEPYFKNESRTRSIINIIKKQRGME